MAGSQLHECNQLFECCSHGPMIQIHLLQSTFNTKVLTMSSACVSWQHYLVLGQLSMEVSIHNLG